MGRLVYSMSVSLVLSGTLERVGLELLDTRIFDSGVVYLRYAMLGRGQTRDGPT